MAGEAPAHSPDTPVFTPTWRAGPAWRPGHHVSPGSSPAWPFGPHPRPAHPSLPQKPWAHRCPHLQGRGPAEAHAGAQEAGAAARQGTSGSLVPAAPPGRGTGSGWACPLGLQSPHNGGRGTAGGRLRNQASTPCVMEGCWGRGRGNARGSPWGPVWAGGGGTAPSPRWGSAGSGHGCEPCGFPWHLYEYLYVAWHLSRDDAASRRPLPHRPRRGAGHGCEGGHPLWVWGRPLLSR